ncbi:hypothetical protein [Flavobacterium davisii]|uniref:hypothetical protein n=1 Tax=Flavobacterium davisii TaxID=2906077 RepID=UPI002869E580|nr:hypothetical protein [Flavobacterium davisii]
MKLDLYKSQWLELVFEGRNKKYGAYELRKENPKTSLRALIIGGSFFALAVASPLLISMIPKGGDDTTLDEKVVLVDMTKPKENTPPPPPPEKNQNHQNQR